MFTHTITQRLQTPAVSAALKLFFVLLIVLEVYASLVPTDDSGVDLPHIDKLVHFVMHWLNVCFAGVLFIKSRHFFIAAVLLFFLGPAIEVLQDLLPHRDASLADQLANTLGFVAGLLTVKYLLHR